ncbi:MAG: hypothetical protein ACLR8P_06150 [Clostridium fessum]
MFGRQKKAIVSALHLPEDVVLGEMLLYFTGSRAAVVENYRSILFSDEMLRLTGKNTRLTIKGRGFRLSIMTAIICGSRGRLCLSNLGCCEE